MTSWQGGREQLSRASAIVFGIFGIFTLLDVSEASEQPPPILQESDSAETLVTLFWLSAHSLEIGYFSKTAWCGSEKSVLLFLPWETVRSRKEIWGKRGHRSECLLPAEVESDITAESSGIHYNCVFLLRHYYVLSMALNSQENESVNAGINSH